jgi:hypothetical protein
MRSALATAADLVTGKCSCLDRDSCTFILIVADQMFSVLQHRQFTGNERKWTRLKVAAAQVLCDDEPDLVVTVVDNRARGSFEPRWRVQPAVWPWIANMWPQLTNETACTLVTFCIGV